MKRKIVNIIIGIVMILVAIAFALVYVNTNKGKILKSTGTWYYTDNYSIENGELNVSKTNAIIDLPGEGICKMSVKWDNITMPGALPLMTITKENGDVVAWISGDSVNSELEFKVDEAANYIVESNYYISGDEFKEAIEIIDKESASKIIIEEDGSFDGFTDFGKEGEWTTQYEVDVNFSAAGGNFKRAGAIIGFFIGLGIAVIILAITKNKGEYKEKYDERQTLVRGKAFKYAFEVAIVYFAMLGIFAEADLLQKFSISGLIMSGIIISICVCASYAIWNDGYFSLSTNKRGLLISFGFIEIANIVLMIISFVSGMIIDNGKVSFFLGIIVSSVVFLVLFIIILVKSIIDRRED